MGWVANAPFVEGQKEEGLSWRRDSFFQDSKQIQFTFSQQEVLSFTSTLTLDPNTNYTNDNAKIEFNYSHSILKFHEARTLYIHNP